MNTIFDFIVVKYKCLALANEDVSDRKLFSATEVVFEKVHSCKYNNS